MCVLCTQLWVEEHWAEASDDAGTRQERGDPEPSEGYPWPVPDAYFSVFHCEVPSDSEGHGEWLAPSAARAQLQARHWWPLAAHVLGLAY